MDQGENLVKDNKRYKLKIIELKDQIKKLEMSEQKLKELICIELTAKAQKPSNKEKEKAESLGNTLSPKKINNNSTFSKKDITTDEEASVKATGSHDVILENFLLKNPPIQNKQSVQMQTPSKPISPHTLNMHKILKPPIIAHENNLERQLKYNEDTYSTHIDTNNSCTCIMEENSKRQANHNSLYETVKGCVVSNHVQNQPSLNQSRSMNYLSDGSNMNIDNVNNHNTYNVISKDASFAEEISDISSPDSTQIMNSKSHESRILKNISPNLIDPPNTTQNLQFLAVIHGQTSNTIEKSILDQMSISHQIVEEVNNKSRKKINKEATPINHNEFLKKTERTRIIECLLNGSADDTLESDARLTNPSKKLIISRNGEGNLFNINLDSAKRHQNTFLKGDNAVSQDFIETDRVSSTRKLKYTEDSLGHVDTLPDSKFSFVRDELNENICMAGEPGYGQNIEYNRMFDQVPHNLHQQQQQQDNKELSSGKLRFQNHTLNIYEQSKGNDNNNSFLLSNTIIVDEGKNNKTAKMGNRSKDLDQKLKDINFKNKGAKVERDKVQLEVEKLRLELEVAISDSNKHIAINYSEKTHTFGDNDDNSIMTSKKDSSNKENVSNDKDNVHKNEIKFLISKLLKVRNKLEKQSDEINITKNLNTTTYNANNNSNTSVINGAMMRKASCDTLGFAYNCASSSEILQNSHHKPSQSTSNAHGINANFSYSSTNKYYQNNPISHNMSYFGDECERKRDLFNKERPKNIKHQKQKSSLGNAIENFTKNIRSNSNIRNEAVNRSIMGFSNNNIDGGNSVITYYNGGLNTSNMRSTRVRSPNTHNQSNIL